MRDCRRSGRLNGPFAPHAKSAPTARDSAGARRVSRPIFVDGRFTFAGGSYEHDIDNPAGDRFTMPVRVGPWIHSLQLEDQGTSDKFTWTSFGGRVEVEPEVVLAATPNFEFSLFSALSLAAGTTKINSDIAGVSEDFDSHGSAFGLEIGPRFRWSRFLASVSYLHRQLSIAESDPTNNVVVFGFDNSFNGIAVSFGGGF